MEIEITIDTDNAAFEDDATSELYRIVESLRYKLWAGDIECEPGARYPLRDSNGNRVGFFAVKA